MTALRTPTAVLLVVVAALGVGPVAGAYATATGASSPVAASAPPDGNVTNGSNASLGAAVSSFMQASAADADGEVENGMFAAKFNGTNASQRARLVHARAGDLAERAEELREERAELLNATDDGNITVAERARAARLAARIDALEEAINRTRQAAERAGVNLARLDELRTNASELTGQEVAAIATELVGRGQGDGERGPPEDRGPEEAPVANESDSGNEGPPDDPGSESREPDAGPPDDGSDDGDDSDADGETDDDGDGPPAEASETNGNVTRGGGDAAGR